MALACIGLYGTLSYVVNLRRRELGLWLALGALRRDILLGVGHDFPHLQKTKRRLQKTTRAFVRFCKSERIRLSLFQSEG